MIKEAYCSFEISKLLKEKGFNWDTQYVYTLDGTGSTPPKIGNWRAKSNIQKPTHQMAMAWLREVHKLPINIWYDKEEDTPDDEVWTCEIAIGMPYILVGSFASYEDAVEAALKYCLENLI